MSFDVLKWNVVNKFYRLKPVTVFNAEWLQLKGDTVYYSFVSECMPDKKNYTAISCVANQKNDENSLVVDESLVKQIINRVVDNVAISARWTRLEHTDKDLLKLKTNKEMNWFVDEKSGFFKGYCQCALRSLEEKKFYNREKSKFEKLSNAGSVVLPFGESKQHVKQILEFALKQKKSLVR